MKSQQKRRLWVLVLCAASFLLSSWSFFQVGDELGTVWVNGTRRTYNYRIPRGGLQPGAPAVIVLHGSESTGTGMRLGSDWRTVADREGLLVVYPDAGPNGAVDSWDVGWVANHPDVSPNPDVAFLRALIQDLPLQFGVNPRRIYMCGLSIGSVMSGRMAGEASDLLAAVGLVSGTAGRRVHGRTVAPPRPESPIPVMTVHGARDVGMPLAGGTARQLWSLERCAEFWQRANGIQVGQPQTQRGPGWTRQRWSGASRRSEVVLLTLDGQGHCWPSGTAAELWAFFERHALP